MTYSLIVPVMVNFEGLANLLASIDEPFVPIVVDNWVDNRGVAAGWNYGIRKSIDMGIDQFVIMNDDAKFERGSSPSQLIRELDDNTAFVMAEQGFAAFATHKTAIDRIGYFDEYFYPAYYEDNDFAYRAKLEDNDFAYRAKLEGMTYKGIIHCKVIHEGSKTQFWNGHGDEERTVSHDQFRKNRDYFVEKWGGMPGSETFTTPFDGKERGTE